MGIFPVPVRNGRLPVISSGFGEDRGDHRHEGVDLMFKRVQGDPRPALPWYGSGYIMMPGTPALAALDGVVKYAEMRPKGHAVRISHGNGFDTCYFHLYSLAVRAGQKVRAGTALGTIGDDPTNPVDPAHLHFEVRINNDAHDPKQYVSTWTYVKYAGGSLLLLAAVAGGGYFVWKKLRRAS